jgi:hypothetical protein
MNMFGVPLIVLPARQCPADHMNMSHDERLGKLIGVVCDCFIVRLFALVLINLFEKIFALYDHDLSWD